MHALRILQGGIARLRLYQMQPVLSGTGCSVLVVVLHVTRRTFRQGQAAQRADPSRRGAEMGLPFELLDRRHVAGAVISPA